MSNLQSQIDALENQDNEISRLHKIEAAARHLLENSTARNDFNYFDGTWNIELYMDSETWERFKNQLVEAK